MAEKITKTKKAQKKPKAEKKPTTPVAPVVSKERYFEAIGRRKTAIARVRLFTKNKDIKINNKTINEYFPILFLQKKVTAPLEKMKISDKFGVIIKVKGGGLSAQAEAVSLGIARALVKFNSDFKKRLRRFGYLTRDSRMVERKKYGLKKARRAPQWKKR
jgi:small subunit ribosomal protein S9